VDTIVTGPIQERGESGRKLGVREKLHAARRSTRFTRLIEAPNAQAARRSIWFARKAAFWHISVVKTTLDIPNDIYRQVKAVAALEGILIKDLVTEGLRLTLEERKRSRVQLTPLDVLREIRRRPLHAPEDVASIIENSHTLRGEGWNRADLP